MIRFLKCSIDGYKSIKNLDEFELGSVNVLIGSNGSGKSNFISFFRMLSWMLGGNLQSYLGTHEGGSASKVLHDGQRTTPVLGGWISLETDKRENEYAFKLSYAAGDVLVFSDERYRFSNIDYPEKACWLELPVGGRESRLREKVNSGDKTAEVIQWLLRQLVVHQFHDTSFKSRMRQTWELRDDRHMKEDGANLASVLKGLHDGENARYTRIVDVLQVLLPFFEDFELEPRHDRILLQWTEKDSDVVFDASQASDGMLRTMALVTLLSMPPDRLPAVLMLDEPELGLHPAAISVVAGMIRSLAETNQVVLATQSAAMVDEFEPEQVVVVEREGRQSGFKRLQKSGLEQWLQDYSLAEMWEKNLLGGRP